MHGAFFFISTRCKCIVGRAPIFGIGASASIAARGYCLAHINCASRYTHAHFTDTTIRAGLNYQFH
jgi:hypothetical protein